jgi:hypothetical protein
MIIGIACPDRDDPAGCARGRRGPSVDHIVIGVPDLDAATLAFDDRYRLSAVEGGRHPGWDTANRLIPLGSTYLELVTVVDQVEASNSAFGRWVSAMASGADPALGWAVRTNDLEGTASRLGLEVVNGERRSRSGVLLQWQIAGVAEAASDSALPFVIQWASGTPLPGQTSVRHHTDRHNRDRRRQIRNCQ